MKSQFYQNAGHGFQARIKAEEHREQEQDGHQHQQQGAPNLSTNTINSRITSRIRANSYRPLPYIQPITSKHSSSYEYDENARQSSSTDYGYASPYGHVGRLSGNFNAPTEIELQRERENRRSSTHVEKLRSKLKKLVKM